LTPNRYSQYSTNRFVPARGVGWFPSLDPVYGRLVILILSLVFESVTSE
jgi:hypothetical protein